MDFTNCNMSSEFIIPHHDCVHSTYSGVHPSQRAGQRPRQNPLTYYFLQYVILQTDFSETIRTSKHRNYNQGYQCVQRFKFGPQIFFSHKNKPLEFGSNALSNLLDIRQVSPCVGHYALQCFRVSILNGTSTVYGILLLGQIITSIFCYISGTYLRALKINMTISINGNSPPWSRDRASRRKYFLVAWMVSGPGCWLARLIEMMPLPQESLSTKLDNSFSCNWRIHFFKTFSQRYPSVEHVESLRETNYINKVTKIMV